MSSTKTILILLGLIVGLNLGLRYGWVLWLGPIGRIRRRGLNGSMR